MKKTLTSFSWSSLCRALCDLLLQYQEGAHDRHVRSSRKESLNGVAVLECTPEGKLSVELQEQAPETPPPAQGGSAEKFGPSLTGSSQISPIQSLLTNEDTLQDAAPVSASDSHARQRTSKRLAEREQKRGADKESKDAPLTRNVPAMLGPIFGHSGWGALLINGLPDSGKVEGMAVDGSDAREDGSSKEDVITFLSSLECKDLWEFAVRLLRKRTMQPADLEDSEPAHLVQLDVLLQPMWKHPPLCTLTLAEMHLDHALQPSTRSERIESTEIASCLRHCERNLLTCHKQFLLGVMPAGSIALELEKPVAILRYHWCRAMLLECQQKFEQAVAHYHCCLAICSDNLPGPVVLHHWKRDNRIDAAAVRKKLEYAKLLGQLCDMEFWRQQGRAQELIDALSPLVLSAEGATTKGRMLNRVDKIKALQLLQDASAALRPAAKDTEMMADLVLLDQHLPKLSLGEDTINDHYGAVHGKTPPALVMACRRPPKNNKAIMTAMKKLLSLGEAVLQQQAPVPGEPLFRCFQDGANLSLMRNVRLRVLQHLEWCYWRFQSHVKRGQDAAQLMSQRCNALCEAARAVVVLHQVDPDAGSDPQSTEDLLATMFRLLGDRDALMHQQGTVLKLFLTCLRAAALRKMAEYGLQPGCSTGNTPQGSPFSFNSNVSSEPADSLLDALGDGISQCLYCLYGLVLGLGSQQWGGGYTTAPKDRLVMNSRETCLEVWRSVQPYLEITASKDPKKNYRKFTACKGFLREVSTHFTTEPPDAVATLCVDALLDDPNFDEDSILNGVLPDFLDPRSAQRMEALQDVADREVHNSLHYWSALSTVEESMDYNVCDGALGDNADEKIEEQVRWVKWDLVFNPTRCWSWETLGMCYKDASETLWDNAAMEVQPGAWSQHGSWIRRLERLQRWQLRCLVIARALGAKDNSVSDSDMAELDEALGEVAFNVLQRVPPQHHGKKRANNLDAEYQAKCRFALRRYKEAASVLSEEWTFMLYVGKLTWKLKEEDWESNSIDIFAQTAMFATVHGGGLVEPIYRLHATRLKLLIAGNHDWGMLTRYMFSPDTNLQAQVEMREQAEAGDGASGESLELLDKSLFQAVFSDCVAALLFCGEEAKYYHKALYRLADAYYHQGDLSKADGYLRQLFSRGKRAPAFFINVWKIETEKCGMRRASTKRGARTANQASQPRPHSQDTLPAPIPRCQWGRRPARVVGIGVMDSGRKYVAALRTYVRLYLKILYRTGDLETLKGAVTCLKAAGGSGGAQALRTASGTCPCLSDMAPLALGYFLILLVQKLRVLLPHPLDVPDFKSEQVTPPKEHQKDAPASGGTTPGSSPELCEHHDDGRAAPAPQKGAEQAADAGEASHTPAKTCNPLDASPGEKDGEEDAADVCIPEEAGPLLEQTYNMYFVRVWEGKSDLSWTAALLSAFEEVSQLPAVVHLTREEVLHDLTAYAHSYPSYLHQHRDTKKLDALAGGFRKRPMAQKTKLGSPHRYRALAQTVARQALATLKALAERLALGPSQAGSFEDHIRELKQLIQHATCIHRHLSGELKPRQLSGLEGLMQQLYSWWCQKTGQCISQAPAMPSTLSRDSNIVRLCEAVLKLPPPRPVAAEGRHDAMPPSAPGLGPLGPNLGPFLAGMGPQDALKSSSSAAGGIAGPGPLQNATVGPALQQCAQEAPNSQQPLAGQQPGPASGIGHAPGAAQECPGAVGTHPLVPGAGASQQAGVLPSVSGLQRNRDTEERAVRQNSRLCSHEGTPDTVGADLGEKHPQPRADERPSASGRMAGSTTVDFRSTVHALGDNCASGSVAGLAGVSGAQPATEKRADADGIANQDRCSCGPAAERQSSELTDTPGVSFHGMAAGRVSVARGHIGQAGVQNLAMAQKTAIWGAPGSDGGASCQPVSVPQVQEEGKVMGAEDAREGGVKLHCDDRAPKEAAADVGQANAKNPIKGSGAFSAAFSQFLKKGRS